MRFLRDENGKPLRTDWREVNFRLHLQVAGGFANFLLDGDLVEAGRRPRGLEGHAELSARDLFLHRLDVGAELEEKLGDAGDDAGLVVSNESNGGEMLGHAGESREKFVGMTTYLHLGAETATLGAI